MPKRRSKAKRKTKRKPSKASQAKQAEQHPALEKVVLLLVSGARAAEIRDACEKLEVDADQIDDVIAAARRRITIAADYDRDTELGTAITRLNDLYARALRQNDTKTCLTTQKEISSLLELKRASNAAAGLDASDDAARSDAAEAESARQQLLPLELAPADAPLTEHARLAVLEILRLRPR